MNFLKLACDDSKRVQPLRCALFRHLVYFYCYPLRPVSWKGAMSPNYSNLLNTLRHVTEHMRDVYTFQAYKRRRDVRITTSSA